MSMDGTRPLDGSAGAGGSSFFHEVRRFGSHSAIYAAGTMAVRLVGFVLVPVYTKHLPREDYGVIGITALVTLAVTTIFSLGLMNSLFRLWPSARTSADRRRLLSTVMWAQVVASAACMAIMLANPGWWARILLGSSAWGRYVVLAVGSGLLDMLTATPLGIVRMEERPAFYVGTMTVRTLVTTGVAIYLVAWRGAGVMGVLVANLVGLVVTVAMLLPMLARRFRFLVDRAALREMLPFGLWIMLSALAGLFLNMGDRYVLKYLLGLSAVGVYALGHQLATTINLFGQSVISAYLPMGLKRDITVDGGRFVTKALTYFAVGLVWVALPFSLLAPEIVHLLARNPAYYPALAVVPPLVFAFVLYVLMLGAQIGFYFGGKAHYATWATLVALVLNLALDFVLVPRVGIVGAAVAAAVAAVARFALTYYWAQRVYPLPFEMGRMAAVLALAMAAHVTMLVPGPWWATAGVKLAATAGFLPALWLFGFFRHDERSALRRLVAGALRRLTVWS